MILLIFHLLISISTATVTFDEFQQLKVALNQAWPELRPSSKDQLVINLKVGNFENYWWNLEVVRASYSQSTVEDEILHHIFIFGGYARLEGMTLDGLAITACHEIGHGIGGEPLKSNGSSQEGQSDYYATKYCFPILSKYLKQSTPSQNYPSCMTNENQQFCNRTLDALESSIHFFNYLGDNVSFDQRSQVIAPYLDESDTFYPDAQCRLDTMVDGLFQRPRPICWYPRNLEN
ncbi:hypothetical protein [Halobacteriovorax sp. HLS]|uniref:hypothetical protein n=1 Tax=Halobacteriovorax sp. HLS TaxID=2234000 RepID=UPI000FDA69F4|nr:hypothetical protein [Halobacteriovorax sp. HLS]